MSPTRRRFIQGGAAAGVAAALPGAPAGAITSTQPATGATQFFAEDVLNGQLQFVLGAASYGTAEYGETAKAIDAANARGGTIDAVFDAFTSLAGEVGGFGDASLRRGQRVSARSAYLRAAKYLTVPLFIVLGTSNPSSARQAATYQAMDRRWRAAAELLPRVEPVEIPYGNTTLPGYLMTPGGKRRRRRTVILNNGNDAQNVDLYAYGGLAAVERGYNALIFEGPGQGSVWFLRGIPFRPDWEKVVTPVVDFLVGRPEVDPKQIAIIGWSQGGGLVARAAAFERRLAAVALDPGWTEFVKVFVGLPQSYLDLVAQGKKAQVDQEWNDTLPILSPSQRLEFVKTVSPFGQKGFYDQIKRVQQFSFADVIGRIRAPTLVSEYEFDVSFAGQQKPLFDALRAKKDFHRFSSADGTEFHCAPMAPARRNQVIFDFFDDALPG